MIGFLFFLLVVVGVSVLFYKQCSRRLTAILWSTIVAEVIYVTLGSLLVPDPFVIFVILLSTPVALFFSWLTVCILSSIIPKKGTSEGQGDKGAGKGAE